MAEAIETVVVGGGQSGLAMSYCLTQRRREHVVLEQGRLSERWRSQRWDSLRFQFPRWSMQLPGYQYQGDEPDGFASRDEVVRFFEGYAASFEAPLRCGVRVHHIEHRADSGRFLVETDAGSVDARNVVLATGVWQDPIVPPFSAALPSRLAQVHSSDYRNPSQLPPGAVLIVGSAASGCQIAEDLLADGRRVLLSVGTHNRVPRRYRRQDFTWWGFTMGRYDVTVDRRPPGRFNPLLTGVGGGHTIDLRRLAGDGVTLLGRILDVSDGVLHLAPDLQESLVRADESLVRFTQAVDEHVRQHGLAVPEEPESEHISDPPEAIAPLGNVDLLEAGISAVVWATGYRGPDFRWLRLPIVDGRGEPIHQRGVTALPGFYFLGLQWQHKLKSAFLWGVGEDAEYLAAQIVARSALE